MTIQSTNVRLKKKKNEQHRSTLGECIQMPRSFGTFAETRSGRLAESFYSKKKNHGADIPLGDAISSRALILERATPYSPGASYLSPSIVFSFRSPHRSPRSLSRARLRAYRRVVTPYSDITIPRSSKLRRYGIPRDVASNCSGIGAKVRLTDEREGGESNHLKVQSRDEGALSRESRESAYRLA